MNRASPNQALQPLLNDRELARIIGLSVATIRRWRLQKNGPPATKIGAAVRYKPADVKAWLDSQPSVGEFHVIRLRCDDEGRRRSALILANQQEKENKGKRI